MNPAPANICRGDQKGDQEMDVLHGPGSNQIIFVAAVGIAEMVHIVFIDVDIRRSSFFPPMDPHF